MLNIPGRRCYTCEGPTRRELLRDRLHRNAGAEPAAISLALARPRRAKVANKYAGARGFGVGAKP